MSSRKPFWNDLNVHQGSPEGKGGKGMREKTLRFGVTHAIQPLD